MEPHGQAMYRNGSWQGRDILLADEFESLDKAFILSMGPKNECGRQ
jgi:hypothetical protein